MSMIQVSIDRDRSGGELRALYDWLQKEQMIRQHSRITLEGGKPASGEMGALFDVIQLAVNSSFQVSALIVSIASWRATRKNKGIDVTINIDADTAEITDALRRAAEDS